MDGFVNSIQSLGALDGPGVRYTVFLQGCNLRCGCCHNPETWECGKGTRYSAKELADKAMRYKEYFGNNGGVTLSGGEPLLQAEFAAELLCICREYGINTCIDTSGSIINPSVLKLLGYTDRVLLDIKYTEDALYREYAGCSIEAPLAFLDKLEKLAIPTVLRQVVIPTINDTEDNIRRLNDIARRYSCVDKIELLPFKKLCQVKYDKEKLLFRFAHIPCPTKEIMDRLQALLCK